MPNLGYFLNMTEKEKMLAGEIYSAVDPEVIKELEVTLDFLAMEAIEDAHEEHEREESREDGQYDDFDDEDDE